MISTHALREKYQRKQRGIQKSPRFKAGGEDVLRLCEYADDLLAIVRWAQKQLSTEQQNDIERKLWEARTRP